MVGALVDAKRSLATGWRILDGTDGAAPAVDHAFSAALAGIDAVYAIEPVNAYNADATSRVKIGNCWDKRGQLPGFAFGT